METTIQKPGGQRTILIIEDEQTLRTMYSRKLSAAGFSVIEAVDGVAGLALALQSEPDLILLDMRMPNMNGFEMLKRLRTKNEWGSHVPVIFLTNTKLDSDAEVADIESTEPAHYLIKSNTDLNELVDKIQDLLQK